MTVILLVFVGVFTTTALLIAASGAGATQNVKQTLARLDAVLVSGKPTDEELVDIRKQELLSSIPWLNRLLLRMELIPRLRALLYQADSKWTPSMFILISLVCPVAATLILHMRISSWSVSSLIALVFGLMPLFSVIRRRTKRLQQF